MSLCNASKSQSKRWGAHPPKHKQATHSLGRASISLVPLLVLVGVVAAQLHENKFSQTTTLRRSVHSARHKASMKNNAKKKHTKVWNFSTDASKIIPRPVHCSCAVRGCASAERVSHTNTQRVSIALRCSLHHLGPPTHPCCVQRALALVPPTLKCHGKTNGVCVW